MHCSQTLPAWNIVFQAGKRAMGNSYWIHGADSDIALSGCGFDEAAERLKCQKTNLDEPKVEECVKAAKPMIR
jgi:hypothetical protein